MRESQIRLSRDPRHGRARLFWLVGFLSTVCLQVMGGALRGLDRCCWPDAGLVLWSDVAFLATVPALSVLFVSWSRLVASPFTRAVLVALGVLPPALLAWRGWQLWQ